MNKRKIVDAGLKLASSPLVGPMLFSVKFVIKLCVAGCFLCVGIWDRNC